ncbi:MAG: FAD-linked oxidase C-terminal domain-containing protein [Bacillota bacterium]|nr:FAD-linked oxidase C-terminal domain-containing protein [Bacillota bacterium]
MLMAAARRSFSEAALFTPGGTAPMIPRPRPATPLGRELARLMGPGGFVLCDRPDLLAYSYDATGKQSLPAAVVFPACTDDVARVMSWAAAKSMPVVPRGAGTNLSGGTVPLRGGVVVEVSRLKRVLATDLAGRRAVVQPGITNLALQQYLAPLGWAFAPDPASQKASTIGGNVAENAGGPHCLKYGVTADHVLGLTAVLDGGEVVRIGYGPGSDPGLDAVSLLVGSEGTLAVFTEVVVRLEPLPAAVKTLLAVYDRLEDAGRTVSEIIGRRMLPATLELMDRTTLQTVEESFHLGYPTDAEGALIIEVDGLEPGLPRQVAQIETLCRECGARSVSAARDEAERDRLWLGRRAAFGALARRSPIYSVQDATVPRDRMVEMMRAVEDISRRHGLETAIVAHAGDGNLHPIILYREATPERLARVEAANEEMLGTAVAMGGTISGEHGVGLEKLHFLPMAVPPAALRAMSRVKDAFDPHGRLNPGKALVSPDRPAPTPAPSGPGDALGQLAERIRAAARDGGGALTPAGLGTRQGWRPAAPAGAARIATTGLTGMVALDGANLTASVRAGTLSRSLAAELASAGFWLPPLDHGWAGTVGGDVATDILAPSRAATGGLRRWLLGVEFIDGLGEAVRAGGKTMKNVAGYDLVRPLVGSHGRLGLITELTFRLLPVPELDVTLCCPLGELTATGESLRALVLATRPLAVAAVGPVDAGSGCGPGCGPGRGCAGAGPLLLVRLAGLREDVDWAGRRWLADMPALRQVDPGDADATWLPWTHPLRDAAAGGRLLRFDVPPLEAPDLARALAAGPHGAGGRQTSYALCLVAGCGLAAARVQYSGDMDNLAAIRAGVTRRGGGVTEFARDVPAWPSGPLDGRIRRAFDPHGVFDGGGAGK